MHEIYELKEMLMKELKEYGSKGELSGGSLEVIDKLAHAIKNLCKIIEAAEEEDYSMAGGSYRGGSRGGSYRNDYNMGGSYARGRGGNTRRNKMGRYSSESGYSRNEGIEDMIESIRDIMQELPQDTQREAQKFVKKLEQEMM